MSEFGIYGVFDRLLLGEQNSGWIQMLVFAVLIGLSAVSSFIKSRKQKRDLERQERPVSRPPQRPVRRQEISSIAQERPDTAPVYPGQGRENQPQAPRQSRPRTIIRPGSALGAFVAEIKAEIKRAGEEMQGIKIPPQSPTPEHKEPVKVLSPLVETAPPQRLARPIPQEEVEHLSEIAPEFSGPDDLRRAIVYYEILGKPLSIRGRTDHLIGL